MAPRPQRSTASEEQKGSSSDASQKERWGKKQMGGGLGPGQRMVQGRGDDVTASAWASTRADRTAMCSSSSSHRVGEQTSASWRRAREIGEKARGRRRGTDLVDVTCTEEGAAGTGRGRGAESGDRRLDTQLLLGRCVRQSEHQLRVHSADAGADAIGRPDGVRGEDAHLGCTRRADYGAVGFHRWLCVRRERVLQAKAEGQRQRCQPEKRRA